MNDWADITSNLKRRTETPKMKQAAAALKAGQASSLWEPKYPFDLLVAYEDNTTRDRALRLYDHLAQQLLDDYDFQCTWWKLDHLRSSTLRDQASDAAAEANMIILSVREGLELSPNVRTWIESWIGKRDSRKSALVALVGGRNQHDPGASPVVHYLQRVARQGKMDFFAHAFDLPQAEGEAVPSPVLGPPTFAAALLDDGLVDDHSTNRWGINE
jgi:hypothetical protein